MQIGSSFPVPLNPGASSPTRHSGQQQRSFAASSPVPAEKPAASTPGLQSFAPQHRFVPPASATSTTARQALRQYHDVQQAGGPELMNRIDVKV